jgi:hypothetical protein
VAVRRSLSIASVPRIARDRGGVNATHVSLKRIGKPEQVRPERFNVALRQSRLFLGRQEFIDDFTNTFLDHFLASADRDIFLDCAVQRDPERPEQIFRGQIRLPVRVAHPQNFALALFQSCCRFGSEVPSWFPFSKGLPRPPGIELVSHSEKVVMSTFVAAGLATVDLDERITALNLGDLLMTFDDKR